MELLGFTKLSKKSISKELEEYVKGIKEETGRIAYIKNLQSLGQLGQAAGFIFNNSLQISVEIVEDNFLDSKGELCKEEIECMIAHEVTHGLLAYKKNYCCKWQVKMHLARKTILHLLERKKWFNPPLLFEF